MKPPLKILLEMRPALDGHAGIPQEARLLFRALNLLDQTTVEGLIQSSGQVLHRGLPSRAHRPHSLSMDQQIDRLSRVVVSLQRNPRPRLAERFHALLALGTAPIAMVLRYLSGQDEELSKFDATHFKDFIWRSLFAKTLPIDDIDAVTNASFRVARVPWTAMHTCALLTRKLGHAVYPRLDTRDFDVMIAETPYPASVSKRTKLVVRYHDAIPILMPHTISDKSYHQASHFQALRCNVANGAHFACVSDATRRDLLSIFPEVEERAVTIHNMVSHHYFSEPSSPIRIREIIRTRLHTGQHVRARVHESLHGFSDILAQPLDFLLMVATIEPRKNHGTLLAAWEQLRTEKYSHLKLVIVGMLGWDHEAIVSRFQPWLERSELFLLEAVPAAELRILYRHARATVCPSYYEGFDFSGIEAMRCGGAVAASDIAVHRDVYGDAAEYFNPYSAEDAAVAIEKVIDPAQPTRRQELISAGERTSARYLPDHILPQWHSFLQRLCAS